MCTMCVPSTLWSQKWVLDPLVLELQVAMNHHWMLGTKSQCFARATGILNHWAINLSTPLLHLVLTSYLQYWLHLCYCNRIPDRSKGQEERFILTYGFRRISAIHSGEGRVERLWQSKHLVEMTGAEARPDPGLDIVFRISPQWSTSVGWAPLLQGFTVFKAQLPAGLGWNIQNLSLEVGSISDSLPFATMFAGLLYARALN